MDKNFLKSILAPLVGSVLAAALITYITTKENTKDITRIENEIDSVKKDYISRKEFEATINGLKQTTNRIDRNVERVIEIFINRKYNN